MRIDQCYRVLGLSPGATLDEVKKAFRAQAFKLHPDLNREDPQASRRFQLVNKAYVVLKAHLEAAAGPGREEPRREPPPPPPPGGDPRGSASAGPEKPKQKSPPRTEEVLKDILKDPFARQVFEDIYSQIRKTVPKRDKPGPETPPPGAAPPQSPPKKKLRFQWGDKEMAVDLSHGVWHAVKSWLAGQLDEEQTVYLAGPAILPGAKVRLQVRQGLSNEPVHVEVTVPPGYMPGAPIRLKGLGRKIGSWRGDLYVRLLSK